MNYSTNNQIYLGDRGEAFKKLISGLLEMGGVKKHYREQLLSQEALVYFGSAFTHDSADSSNNYQLTETIGDSCLNKIVISYLLRRFPQLFSPLATDILTKLKITIIQTKVFSEIADSLDFWRFISCDQEIRASTVNKMAILEDVFESFIGSLEWFIDERFKIGVGYGICYAIVSKILDKREISLKYTDLVDSKTRLKELFDSLTLRGFGKIQYLNRNSNTAFVGPDKIYDIYILQTYPNGQTRVIGEGKNVIKINAEKEAAEQALKLLASEGFNKKVPDEYLKFCN